MMASFWSVDRRPRPVARGSVYIVGTSSLTAGSIRGNGRSPRPLHSKEIWVTFA